MITFKIICENRAKLVENKLYIIIQTISLLQITFFIKAMIKLSRMKLKA